MFEGFALKKTKLDLACHDHFSKIRRQIDTHREKLKEKSDDIALETIDQTKKFESSYLKSLSEKLNSSLKSFEKKTVDEELKDTGEKFRDPNLLIEAIREILLKQDKSIGIIKAKLKQMEDINEHLPEVYL